MTTKTYELSLLPTLREQAQLFCSYNDQVEAHLEKEYGSFLAFIDQQSESSQGSDVYEDLRSVYGLVAERQEKLLGMLAEEQEELGDLIKLFNEMEEKGESEKFAELAHDLVDEGDYKTDTKVFRGWMDEEVKDLNSEISEIVADWKAAVEEGKALELARVLEAINSDEDPDGEDDDLARLFEEFGEGDESENAAGGCCRAAQSDDEEAGCCGRQDPCCRDEK